MHSSPAREVVPRMCLLATVLLDVERFITHALAHPKTSPSNALSVGPLDALLLVFFSFLAGFVALVGLIPDRFAPFSTLALQPSLWRSH